MNKGMAMVAIDELKKAREEAIKRTSCCHGSQT